MTSAVPAWNQKFETGIRAVDNDHKALFDEIRHLAAALIEQQSADAIDQAIKCLETYVHEHFQREETFMLSAGYPKAEQHMRIHRALTRQVECLRIINRDNLGEIDPLKLATFLSDWLSNHILKVDMDYVPYLQGETDKQDHDVATRLHEVNMHVPANKLGVVESFLRIILSDHPVAAELAGLVETFEARLAEHEISEAKKKFCVGRGGAA